MSTTTTQKRVRIGQVYLSPASAQAAKNIVTAQGGTITGIAGTVLDAVLSDMTPESMIQQLAAAQQAVRSINKQ